LRTTTAIAIAIAIAAHLLVGYGVLHFAIGYQSSRAPRSDISGIRSDEVSFCGFHFRVEDVLDMEGELFFFLGGLGSLGSSLLRMKLWVTMTMMMDSHSQFGGCLFAHPRGHQAVWSCLSSCGLLLERNHISSGGRWLGNFHEIVPRPMSLSALFSRSYLFTMLWCLFDAVLRSLSLPPPLLWDDEVLKSSWYLKRWT